jgi:ABC-type transporter Mla subunit MlaD
MPFRKGRPRRGGDADGQALDDLQDKDEEIDDLLAAAAELTAEFRASVEQASARLRSVAGRTEDGHDSR